MSLNNKNTIREIMGVYPVNGDVGIEIEAEAEDGPNFPTNTLPQPWKATHDGSLRGIATEYVMQTPVPVGKVGECVDKLAKRVEKEGTKVKYSFRAGVHAHINCQELTPQQVVIFACLYYSLENVLVEWCGDDRVGNLFCLRVRDAEYVLPYVAEIFRRNGGYGDLATNHIRYASLNYCALTKYGSLEFRAMATEKDFSKIADWATILYNLREQSKGYDSIETLLERFSLTTPEEWCKELLGDYWPQFKDQNNINPKVWEGIRYAQDFLFYTL